MPSECWRPHNLPAQFWLCTIEFCHHKCLRLLTFFLGQFGRINLDEVALEVNQSSMAVITSAFWVNAVCHKALDWLQGRVSLHIKWIILSFFCYSYCIRVITSISCLSCLLLTSQSTRETRVDIAWWQVWPTTSPVGHALPWASQHAEAACNHALAA